MEWFTSTVLVLGIGTCDGAGDYCVEPLAEARFEQSIIEYGRHSTWATVSHYSDPNAMDQGVNALLIEYRYKIR